MVIHFHCKDVILNSFYIPIYTEASGARQKTDTLISILSLSKHNFHLRLLSLHRHTGFVYPVRELAYGNVSFILLQEDTRQGFARFNDDGSMMVLALSVLYREAYPAAFMTFPFRKPSFSSSTPMRTGVNMRI